MASNGDISVRVNADASGALEALLMMQRDVIRLDYGAPDLTDKAADFLIAAESARDERFWQTPDYPPLMQLMGSRFERFDNALLRLMYAKSWKQLQLEKALAGCPDA